MGRWAPAETTFSVAFGGVAGDLQPYNARYDHRDEDNLQQSGAFHPHQDADGNRSYGTDADPYGVGGAGGQSALQGGGQQIYAETKEDHDHDEVQRFVETVAHTEGHRPHDFQQPRDGQDEPELF